jgi:hypothetical protein
MIKDLEGIDVAQLKILVLSHPGIHLYLVQTLRMNGVIFLLHYIFMTWTATAWPLSQPGVTEESH